MGWLGISFCAIWSSAFVATKMGLASSPPLILASMRFLIAGPLMILIAVALRHPFPKDIRFLLLLALLGVLNNTLYLGLTFLSLQTVSAALTSLIATLNPLITALLSSAFLGEGLTARKAAGLLVGIAGAVSVVQRRLHMSLDDPLGVALSVLGLLSLALGTILFKKLVLRTSVLMISGLQVLMGGVALLPVALLFESARNIIVDANLSYSAAYLTMVVSVLGTLIWFRLLQAGTASASSAYHFLTPAFGLLFAWIVAGENIVWSDILGIVPIALAIMLVANSPQIDRMDPSSPEVAFRLEASSRGHASPASKASPVRRRERPPRRPR